MPTSTSLTSFLVCLSLLLPLHAALLPYISIRKDHTTLQYTATIYLKTPLKPENLVLDLGASFTWLDCYTDYNSSTYLHVPCDTPLCDSFHSLACGNCYEPPGPACANNTCEFFPENPITHHVNLQPSIIDTLALTSYATQESKLVVTEKFIFSCARTQLLKGLAKGVSGMLAFGRSNISLPLQISSTLSVPPCFALCLSRSKSGAGFGLIGSSGPYLFSNGVDVSKTLTHAPLIINPVGGTIITYFGRPSAEYFVPLTSIRINGKAAPLNQTLLTIDRQTGFGGTKISTVVPYMTLETSIYKAFTNMFLKEINSAAINLTLSTKPPKPFKFCYSYSSSKGSVPVIPTVDLVLTGSDGDGNVFWRLYGGNLMVKVVQKKVDFWCLGVLDGGIGVRTPIVIGGYQSEDNLLQFDLESNRFGFSSSLSLKGTSCSNFNFTAAALKE